MKAYMFSLLDQSGKEHSLADYHGKWVILYFYPADDTPGCTTEACAFRDRLEEFETLGITLLGVSKGTIDSHKKFAEKYHLTFPLLLDEDMAVAQQYGAYSPKQFMGKPGVLRQTFLINPEGEIVKAYHDVDPMTHTEELLQDIKLLLVS